MGTKVLKSDDSSYPSICEVVSHNLPVDLEPEFFVKVAHVTKCKSGENVYVPHYIYVDNATVNKMIEYYIKNHIIVDIRPREKNSGGVKGLRHRTLQELLDINYNTILLSSDFEPVVERKAKPPAAEQVRTLKASMSPAEKLALLRELEQDPELQDSLKPKEAKSTKPTKSKK